MTRSAYYDESEVGGLRARIDRLTEDWPGVACTRMFGCPAYTADGTLFAVLSTQGIAFTLLPDAEAERLAAAATVEPFRAGPREVDRWATVPADRVDDCDLSRCLRASYEAARGR